MKSLPMLRIPIVRYYSLHLHTHAPHDTVPYPDLYASFAQTAYSQMILSDVASDQKTMQKQARNTALDEFQVIENYTAKLDDHSTINITIYEAYDLPKDLLIADLSEELLETLEIIYLFYKGAIFPGIHKLEMLLDMGVIAMLPFREILSRVLPDMLKINILAEYQLMNFDKHDDDFIDFNLIWFLGKLNLQTVDKFLSDNDWHHDTPDFNNRDEESPPFGDAYDPAESESNDADASAGAFDLNEEDRLLKTELENELKHFYQDQSHFYTRVVGLRHTEFDISTLSEGARLTLVPEPENTHDPMAVSVHSARGEKIGYLKKELAALLFSELRQGVVFHATVVKVLPEAEEANLRLHILVRKWTHHFN
ncbi:MAG TPA: HIRAN domain-containing protein [bacterium]|nr:HIRAN domain-containing protein [bacterium]HNO09345.1 HIRAN domain-containing protein [bacterium]